MCVSATKQILIEGIWRMQGKCITLKNVINQAALYKKLLNDNYLVFSELPKFVGHLITIFFSVSHPLCLDGSNFELKVK
jgi:hypothetical protein